MNSLVTIKVESHGKDPFQFLEEVTGRIHFDFRKRLVGLGEDCANRMIEIIESSRKRPDKGTHLLENNIKSEILNSIGGVTIGIGNIQDLKQNAPYFEVLDAGGYVPPMNVGYFGDSFRAPEPGGYGEDWKHTGKGSGFHLINPTKAIEGINYIGISARELRDSIEKSIEELNSEIGKASS